MAPRYHMEWADDSVVTTSHHDFENNNDHEHHAYDLMIVTTMEELRTQVHYLTWLMSEFSELRDLYMAHVVSIQKDMDAWLASPELATDFRLATHELHQQETKIHKTWLALREVQRQVAILERLQHDYHAALLSQQQYVMVRRVVCFLFLVDDCVLTTTLSSQETFPFAMLPASMLDYVQRVLHPVQEAVVE